MSDQGIQMPEEIDDDAHVSREFAKRLKCWVAEITYGGGGASFPVSGDALTTGRIEDRWQFND